MDDIKHFPSDLGEQIATWLEELAGDPRLMIIIAGARLDNLLKRLLQSKMLHQGGGKDELFGHDRPLGTFSSRILLAYRLGLIDRDYESFLQTLRKLRNDAAHAAQRMDLISSPHIDHIMHMQTLASQSPLWSKFNKAPVNPKSDPKRSLYMSLMIAVFNLECALLGAKPFHVEEVCDFSMLRMAPDASTPTAAASSPHLPPAGAPGHSPPG